MSGKASIAVIALAILAQFMVAEAQFSGNLNLGGSAAFGGFGGIGDRIREGSNAFGNQLNQVEAQIQAAIDNLLNTANDFGSRVSEQIQQALEDLHVRAEAVSSAAASRVDEAIRQASNAIDAANEKAKQLGEAVSPCVKDNVDLEQIRARAIDLLTGCVTDRLKAAHDIAHEVTSNVRDLLSASAEARNQIESQCGSQQDRGYLRCASSIFRQTSSRLATDTKNILLQVNNARSLIMSLKVNLELCMAGKVVSAVIDAGKIAFEVGKCSADNLSNQVGDTGISGSVDGSVTVGQNTASVSGNGQAQLS